MRLLSVPVAAHETILRRLLIFQMKDDIKAPHEELAAGQGAG